MKKLNLFIFLISFYSSLYSGVLFAEAYFVDDLKGNDLNLGSIDFPWRTIEKANLTLVPGDIVFIRSGIYNDSQINPSKSGTAKGYITYKAYPDDEPYSVIIKNISFGYKLINRNYIIIDGLYFQGIGSYWGYLNKSSHNIIKNCKFFKSDSYGGTKVSYSSNFNKWSNNVFEDAPKQWTCKSWDDNICGEPPYPSESNCNCETAPANFISIYSGEGNIIEGNFFGNNSHDAVNIETRQYEPWGDSIAANTVIRQNKFQNKYHTGIDVNPGSKVLVENNFFFEQGKLTKFNPSYGAREKNLQGNPAINVKSSNSIIRYNVLANNSGMGFNFGAKKNGYGDNIRFYHNTLYNNDWNVFHSGNGNYNYKDTILVNNIFYKAKSREVSNYADVSFSNTKNYYLNNATTPGASNFYFKNTVKYPKNLKQLKEKYPDQWDITNFEADPKFSNPNERDFTLQFNSQLIDAASFLTYTTNAGFNSKYLNVHDSKYFYDGWGIPGEEGDYIFIEDTGKVKIASIDYSNKKIILKNNHSWKAGKGIFYCPKGKCFSGKAPDIGAYEYFDKNNEISPPSSLRVKSYN